ncbi:LOW QUALITY PROTEIN: solute carrier family 2, facilitated glucose transporter member 6-like [Aphomia sociella]
MKKYYFFFGEGSKINQIICGVLINIPVFVYGTCIGWMSPMSLLLQSENSPRQPPLTDIEISWIASVPYSVCVVADFLVAYVGDRIGRKLTLIFVSTAAVVLWMLKIASMEIWAFVLARAIVGIPMAGAYVTCPLYMKEISEDSIRGSLGSLVILFHTIGNLFMYIIGDILSYTTVLWICLAVPAIHVVLFMMMPESPSYLVKTGKLQEAARVLAWLRCREEEDIIIKQELERIRQEQKNDEESSKFVLKAILTDKILCRTFRIVMVVCLAREVCGAIPVLNFAGDIFSISSKGTGLILSPNQQAMLLGAVQVAGSIFASSIVEKVGRKPLLFTTSLISGLSMCALASWFVARDYALSTPAWLPVVTLCLCIFCDASGLQPVSVVLNSEMFSFKYRGTIMATTMASASLVAFLQMLFFKPLVNAMGMQVAFFFGVICVLAAVYVILVIPETKMKSIEEIHNKLKTKKERREEERRRLEETCETKESC